MTMGHTSKAESHTHPLTGRTHTAVWCRRPSGEWGAWVTWADGTRDNFPSYQAACRAAKASP